MLAGPHLSHGAGAPPPPPSPAASRKRSAAAEGSRSLALRRSKDSLSSRGPQALFNVRGARQKTPPFIATNERRFRRPPPPGTAARAEAPWPANPPSSRTASRPLPFRTGDRRSGAPTARSLDRSRESPSDPRAPD